MPLDGEYAPGTADWARQQVETYESTGGQQGSQINGKPVVVVTSRGAKTGKLRKTPVMRVEHDGEYAVIASLGGADHNPSWYYNVREHPRVELQDGPVRGDYSAREVTGAEKELWWQRAVAVWPDYANYQRKTAREIPVFVFTPVDGDR